MRVPTWVSCAACAAALGAQSQQIRWSADERLSWTRFAARPDMTSPASAMTAYVAFYNDGCDDRAYWREVFVAFLPEKSWVKSEVVFRGGSVMLQHEQTHFDLAEVTARRIRQALDGLSSPCEMTPEERGKVVATFLQRDREIQARYDAATNFGANTTEQDIWLRRVARDLEQLKSLAAARR